VALASLMGGASRQKKNPIEEEMQRKEVIERCLRIAADDGEPEWKRQAARDQLSVMDVSIPAVASDP
jgi:hypothetical protein